MAKKKIKKKITKKAKKVIKKKSVKPKKAKKKTATKPKKESSVKQKKVQKVTVKTAPDPKKGKRKKIEHYPPPSVTFMDLAQKGKVTMADMDKYIDEWHEDPQATNLLHEFLGMTPKEYKNVLTNSQEGLQDIVEKRNKKAAKKAAANKQA